MNGQNDEVTSEVGSCGPGCNCGSAGLGKRRRWLISGAVVLAACAVTAARISGAREAVPKAEQGYALTAIASNAAAPASVSTTEAGWGAPLKGISELNVVATNTEAVFVVIPSDDAARTTAIQKEVTAAASAITGRGTKIGTFLLSKEAEDYKGVVAQLGAPAVLAMVKNAGMSVVSDKEVTQDALMKAFVVASRPRSSGCGAGGCGPSGCK